MKLIVIAVGRLKAGPERELVARYAKRAAALGPSVGFSDVEFRELEESRARDAAERRAGEGKALKGAVPKGAFLCALDERGAAIASQAWAAEIAETRDAGRSYAIAIGGPDGLDEEVRREAGRAIAFGAMTWPHQLVRVMAAEQIYRVFTILAGHPYHRA